MYIKKISNEKIQQKGIGVGVILIGVALLSAVGYFAVKYTGDSFSDDKQQAKLDSTTIISSFKSIKDEYSFLMADAPTGFSTNHVPGWRNGSLAITSQGIELLGKSKPQSIVGSDGQPVVWSFYTAASGGGDYYLASGNNIPYSFCNAFNRAIGYPSNAIIPYLSNELQSHLDGNLPLGINNSGLEGTYALPYSYDGVMDSYLTYTDDESVSGNPTRLDGVCVKNSNKYRILYRFIG